MKQGDVVKFKKSLEPGDNSARFKYSPENRAYVFNGIGKGD